MNVAFISYTIHVLNKQLTLKLTFDNFVEFYKRNRTFNFSSFSSFFFRFFLRNNTHNKNEILGLLERNLSKFPQKLQTFRYPPNLSLFLGIFSHQIKEMRKIIKILKSKICYYHYESKINIV